MNKYLIPVLAILLSVIVGIILPKIFYQWLSIFSSPLKNFDILWILIPVWISWFFAEFFQEKIGTSFGNAISNGVIPVWVGIDWMRLIVNGLVSREFTLNSVVGLKLFICFIILVYGIVIIIDGIKAKRFIHFIGRIREVSYILIVLTPAIYDIVPITTEYILSIIIFFPLFYYIIEFVDKLLPDPGVIELDK